MKRISNLHRLIALTMAVVMIITLAVFDNRFRTNAANAQENIDISKLESEFDTNIQVSETGGTVITEQLKKAMVATGKATDFEFYGNYYIRVNDGATYVNLATDTDAAKRPVAASSLPAVKVDKDNKQEFVEVYTLEDKGTDLEKYVFKGMIRLLYDDVKPSIDRKELVSTDGIKDKGGYLLVQEGKTVKYHIYAGDADSGVDKVYMKNGDASEELSYNSEGGYYEAAITSTGTYSFVSVDKAGNESDPSSVTLKYAEGIKVTSIEAAGRTDLPSNYGNRFADTEFFQITVKASEKADGVDVPLKLVYTFNLNGRLSENNQVDFENGTAKITVPSSLVNGEDCRGNLTMYVEDEVGGKSYAFDAAGYLIFVDRTAPDVSIKNIRINGKTYGTLDDYQAAGVVYGNEVTFDYDVTEVNSDLADITIEITDAQGNNVVTSIPNVNGVSYSATDNTLSGKGSATFPVSGDGAYNIKIKAKNDVGLTGEASADFNIDSKKPVLRWWSSTVGREITDTDESYTVYVSDNETITVSASDDASGIESVEMTLDGTPVTLTDNAYMFDTPGVYNVKATALDKAGNITEKTIKVTVATSYSNAAISVVADGTTLASDSSSSFIYTGADRVEVVYTYEAFKVSEDNIKNNSTYLAGAFGAPGTPAEYEDCSVTVGPEDPSTGLRKVTVKYVIEKKADASTDGTYSFNFSGTKYTNKDTVVEGTNKSLKIYFDTEAPNTVRYALEGGVGTGDPTTISGVSYYRQKATPKLVVEAFDNLELGNIDVILVNAETNEILGTKTQAFKNQSTTTEGGKQAVATIDLTDDVLKNVEYSVNVNLNDNLSGKSDGKSGNNTTTLNDILRVYWDTVLPEMTANDIGTWFNSDVTIRKTDVTAKDNCDIDHFNYQLKKNSEKVGYWNVSKGAVDGNGRYNMARDLHVQRTNGEGEYILTVYASDKAGNFSSKEFCFVIDYSKPDITITRTPSQKLITSGKTDITVDDTYGVNLNDKNKVKVIKHYVVQGGSEKTVQLSLASSGSRKYFEDSGSGAGFKESIQGVASTTNNVINKNATKYYYEVSVTDEAGNKAYKKTDWFYVDNIAPAVAVKPQNNDYVYSNKEIPFQVTYKDQYSKNEIGAYHKIKIINNATEHAADVSYLNKDTDLSAASGTKNYRINREGVYNLQIKITDAFGNNTSRYTKYVYDVTAPVIRLTAPAETNTRGTSIGYTLSDNIMGDKIVAHVTRRGPSGNVEYDQDMSETAWSGTGATGSIPFDAEGNYTVYLVAYDKAGNKSQSEPVTFVIDKTAPVLSISGMNDMQNTDVNATFTMNEAFGVVNGKSPEATVTITKKVDGSAATTVATLNYGSFTSGNPHTAGYRFTEDGDYSITFSGKDASGNVANTVTRNFKIDKVAPELTIKATKNDTTEPVANYGSVGNVQNPEKVKLTIGVKETFYTGDEVTVSVKKNGANEPAKTYKGITGQVIDFAEDGVYVVTIGAKDAAGNVSEEQTITFTVDNTAPVIKDTDALAGFKKKENNGEIVLNKADFDAIRDKGYDGLWGVDDTSPFTPEAKLDGVDLVDFTDLKDGKHKITLTVTDALGNVTTDEFEFVYDGTLPEIITSVEDNQKLNDPFTLKISLKDPSDKITSIKINDTEIPAADYADNVYEYKVDKYDTYKLYVTAEDAAGNVSATFAADEEGNITSVFTFTLAKKVSVVVWVIIGVAVLLLLGIIIFLIMRRKNNKQAA